MNGLLELSVNVACKVVELLIQSKSFDLEIMMSKSIILKLRFAIVSQGIPGRVTVYCPAAVYEVPFRT